MIRHLKIASALFIGLIGLLFFVGNVFNAVTAHAAVSMVISGVEQPYYRMIGPGLHAPWIATVALITIMAGELSITVFGLSGAYRMFRMRCGSAESFHAAKSAAIGAGAIGMLVWYGLFIVIGEGYFHMWSPSMLQSVEGAFRYGTVCVALALFIASRYD
ncbi:MAG: DUF2165 family protein [Sinimarinibacterium sp.]|jgi:predicted small integral membrane protein